MEGHDLKGNDKSYVKTSEKQLLEEYLKAIDNLTIDPANRLVKQVKTLQVEVSRIDKLEQSLHKLEQKHKEGQTILR